MGILKILSRFYDQKFVFSGVPVIIINSKNQILLGKRSKSSPFYPSIWGLPGGLVDYGETLENAAMREVKEEVGVDIKILKRSSNVYESLPNEECKFHSVGIPFYAKIISGEPKPLDETSEVGWFKFIEIEKMKLAYNHKEILKKEGLMK
jgi:8-oxo-dGTP diphosphatase